MLRDFTAITTRRAQSFWTALEPYRPAIYLGSIHLTLCLISIGLFRWLFEYGKRMILLHILLVIGLIVGSTLFLVGLVSIKWFREWKRARLTVSALLALCFAPLALLYFTDLIANSMWGDNISFLLARDNLSFLPMYLKINASPVWLSIIPILWFLLVFAIYLKVSRPILNSLQELVDFSRTLTSSKKRAARALVVFSTLVLVYASSVLAMLWLVHGAGPAQREPILSLFVPRTFFTSNTQTAALVREDQRIRAHYSPPRTFERKNVILIIADAVRADHMQVYGYARPTTPFLATLVEEQRAKPVALALANCSFTYCGVLSVLASRNEERLHPGNLKVYDLLRDQGYKIYFILSGDHADWMDLRQSFGESVDFYFDGLSSKRFAPNDDRLIFEGLEQVPHYSGTPAFFYFHLMSAHNLGVRLDDYNEFRPSQKEMVGRLLATYDPVVLNNSYDNGIVQVDEMIHRLFVALEQKGYLQDSIVIILADHGQGLGEHGKYGHGSYLYQEQIAIPMLIYDTSAASYGNLEFATQLDVAPTILDRLGLPIPYSWEGESLMRKRIRQCSYHQTMDNTPLRAALLRTNGAIYKYLRSDADQKEELYELVRDPKETYNMISTADTSVIKKMRAIMAEQGLNDCW
jgi:glucan phosphoethanolaminetransferase (alkaline phosphatase superfamily)